MLHLMMMMHMMCVTHTHTPTHSVLRLEKKLKSCGGRNWPPGLEFDTRLTKYQKKERN